MGKTFIEGVASMHQAHINRVRHESHKTVTGFGKSINDLLLNSE